MLRGASAASGLTARAAESAVPASSHADEAGYPAKRRAWQRATGVLAAVGVAAALSGAPAHADDASYLAALDANGLFRSGPPNARLSAGHKFCTELRNGATPDQIAAAYRSLPTFGAPSMIDDLRGSLPAVIAVAQRELCPDTLR